MCSPRSQPGERQVGTIPSRHLAAWRSAAGRYLMLQIGLPLGAFVGSVHLQPPDGLPLRAFPVGGIAPQLGAGLRSLPVSGAAPPPAPSSPCPSVLWRPVEPRWMPGAILHQLAHSEICCANAPWPPQKKRLELLIHCTAQAPPACR